MGEIVEKTEFQTGHLTYYVVDVGFSGLMVFLPKSGELPLSSYALAKLNVLGYIQTYTYIITVSQHDVR